MKERARAMSGMPAHPLAPANLAVPAILTVKALRDSFPQHLKSHATQEMVDGLNQLTTDPDGAGRDRQAQDRLWCAITRVWTT